MATIIDRSPWAVSARNREDLYREFPYNRKSEAEAYAATLGDEGIKAAVKRLANQFQVQSRRKGAAPFCLTVDTLAEAKQLKLNLEAEQSRSVFRDYGAAFRHTVADLIGRYVEEVVPQHKGAEFERYRLNRILRVEFWVDKKVGELVTEDLQDFINDRLTEVAPATVDRELDVIRQVLNWAGDVWKIAAPEDPFKGLKRPKYFNERDRRLKVREEDAILAAARADENPYIEPAIIIALQTAMRRGEILGLTREHIDFEERGAFLPTTKNGRSRKVPLTQVAMDVLRSLFQPNDPRLFPITPNALKLAWSRRVLPKAGIADLHFHDLRHEATSRLAESGQYTLLDLQAITGHRDMRMLQRYAHLCTRKLAEKMDIALPKPTRVYMHRGRQRFVGMHRSAEETAACETSTKAALAEVIAAGGNVILFPERRR